MKSFKPVLYLAILAVALFATYKLAAAAHLTKPADYTMTDTQWRDLTQSREAAIAAEAQQRESFSKYQQIVANIRLQNKWPDDVVFNNQTMKWEQQAKQATPPAAPQPPKK